MPSLTIQSVNRKPTVNPEGIATTLAVAAARFEVATVRPGDPNGRPFTGLLYTGGSQMRTGGMLRALISMALLSPNVAADMVGRSSQVSGFPTKGYHRQSAEHGRRRSQCRRRASATPTGISVFEAVEKELGLKLVKQAIHTGDCCGSRE